MASLRKASQRRGGRLFVNHVKLGGGLCAQAACYIATLLLEEFATGVHGLAEVTSVVTPRTRREFNLGGMGLDAMVSYFKSAQVGLNAQTQLRGFLPLHPTRETADLLWFSTALQGYVVSGMPVIIPVDLGRMYGCGGIGPANSIFHRNNLERDTNNESPMSHAVVVVGHHLRDPHEFLICDPATRPFMRARAIQLFEARPYRNWNASAERRRLRDIAILAATPANVRLPLMDEQIVEGIPGEVTGARLRHGLFSLACTLLDLRSGSSSEFLANVLEIVGNCSVSSCDFRLVHASRLLDDSVDDRTENATAIFPAEVIGALRACMRDRSIDVSWLWLQLQRPASYAGRTCIWMWNACRSSPFASPTQSQRDRVNRYLVGAILCDPVEIRLNPEFMNDSSEPLTPEIAGGISMPTNRGRSQHLRPALISSFLTRGSADSARHWEAVSDELLPCELYSFMQPEVDRLSHSSTGMLPTALQFMADEADNVELIAKISASISRANSFSPVHRPIIGIATFLPGLSAGCSTEGARQTRRSLKFVARLSTQLTQLGHDHPVVEIVSGTTIDGIWPTLPADSARSQQMLSTGKCNFMANWIDDDSAQANLFENLRTLIRDELERDERAVRWALELEPGPLFVIRDWNTLKKAAQTIDKDDVLSGRVFLNLDIAHWRLAEGRTPDTRISPELVTSEPTVLNHILHAHIAGHHPYAHFGDIELDALNRPDSDFGPWLDLLEQLAADPERPFRGYISVELEATRWIRYASRSISTLRRLL